MKRIIKLITVIVLCSFLNLNIAFAIQEIPTKQVQPSANARKVEIAFVFDGPSDKNAEVLKQFQKTISKSLLPDYIAVYPNDLVFTGNWSKESAQVASDNALKSSAITVVSLGYLSSTYLTNKKNKSKFVITIDQYGLRDMGSNAFFSPVKQYVNDFILFKKLVPTQSKTAILMNENFYKTQKNWDSLIKSKFKEKKCDLEFVVIPINSKNYESAINNLPSGVDSVFVTPLFNLSTQQRQALYSIINSKKLPSFSSLGKEDVELGALLGTSTPDADRKLAESTSFNIHGYLHGDIVKSEKIPFYDNDVIFYNKDTGELLGYNAPLRLLNNCQIISHKQLPKYDLSYVFNTLETNNLDIKQEKYLVDAARRSTTAAYLKYLPTLRLDLGYQKYNEEYARSYSDVPINVGLFTVGMDQMIYSPDLVTNIIVKHKKLKFEKAQKTLVEQNIGLNIAFLYLDTLMLDNAVKVQDIDLAETRENLAIAQVRNKKGLCGKEEVLQWAGKVSKEEKNLLGLKAELANIKVQISKILHTDQAQDFEFSPLTANDPAFFSSDLHIIDHVRTPDKLEKFTQMLIEETIALSPETAKLRAAIAMKKAEMANYGQKFLLPNAMLTLEHGTQFNRDLPYEAIGHRALYSAGIPWIDLDKNSTRLAVVAQWKPIEGGQKVAEIARCKAELNQLNTYLTEVNTQIEMNIREVINRAISKYFMIEKSYKAMFAQSENYQIVKENYLNGKAPISQLSEAQDLYVTEKLNAMNSQYEFFKELLWVQRGLISVNWTKPLPQAKEFIKKIPEKLPAEDDFSL